MDKSQWNRRMQYLENWRPAPDLWAWLEKSNQEFGCSSTTLANIQGLRRGAVAVVTGQQAGLLTGPLYTMYKAASAVMLAAKLRDELQRPVVPVFWLASEDHDFQEASWAGFPGHEKLIRIQFPGEYSLTPMAEIPLTAHDVEAVITQLEDILPATEFTPQVLDLVLDSAGPTFSSWCGGLLTRLFGQMGLVLIDSCGPPLRRAASSVFVQAIEQGEEIHSLLAAQAKAMDGEAPLDISPRHSHLFYLQAGKRLGLLRDGDRYFDRRGEVNFNKAELLRMAEHQPEKLSPNVVLRPLVQELVVPVLAMVGGPGELAYMEQMAPVFPLMGMEQPPVLPRAGGVLIEPGIARLLTKHQLRVKDVELGLEPWLQKRLGSETQKLTDGFAQLRRTIHAEYARLMPRLKTVDRQLPELGETNLTKVLAQVSWLEKRALGSHRQRHRTLLQQVKKMQMALAPDGEQQQRSHNCLWYLNKYGPGFIDTILQSLDPNREIYL